MEVWKDIEGYKERYMISNFGNVYSKKRKRLLKNSRVWRYSRVTLHSNGRIMKCYCIHRLVGKYFVDGFKNGLELNHKDGDRYNNHHSNLEWVTHQENVLHSHDNGMTKRWIRKILLDTQTGVFYESISEAAKYHRYTKETISKMLLGTRTNKTNFIIA